MSTGRGKESNDLFVWVGNVSWEVCAAGKCRECRVVVVGGGW